MYIYIYAYMYVDSMYCTHCTSTYIVLCVHLLFIDYYVFEYSDLGPWQVPLGVLARASADRRRFWGSILLSAVAFYVY